ncbi:MAG TPA: hypothetical protein VIV60_02705 [Polyangiaceae bacterium]
MKPNLLSNRQWWLTAATLSAAILIFFFGRGSLPKAGQFTTYVITVVPSDAAGLACASSVVIANQRCAYDDQQLQPSRVERPLRPYVTVGRELLLLSGVFESKSVSDWLAQARQTGDEARVTLTCRARILGPVATTSVRWAPDGQFQPEHNVMAANVNDCTVQR